MKILDKAVYVGPSIYALFPVIRLDVDLGSLEEWPTKRLGPGFTSALLDVLPGLKEHGCSYGEPGGFLRRLDEDEGTWLGHVLEHVAIELQNAAGEQVSFGKTRSTGVPGQYHVVYEYEQAEVGLEAGRLALDIISSCLPEELRFGKPITAAAERDTFIKYAQRRALGPSTMSLVHIAEQRGIPWMRLNQYSLVQFGHGKYQQRIQATVTSRTPHIAVELASDKEETNKILGDLGLPVPRQALVHRADDAAKEAARIGFPIVVKPYNANHGRGVSLHLQTPDEVKTAFAVAQEHSRSVIVESYITGMDHRMCVVDGSLIAVALREPGHVVGDGVHTIEELVAEVNSDPRRGIGHEKVLTRIEFDNQADTLLAKKGYTKQTVPAEGEKVYLRSTGNLSTGGTARDVTDVVHPDNVEMAVRAVKAIGLDVGGVDFLCEDITRSYKESGGAICEINAAPGFRMHLAPSEGSPRDVAGAVMAMLFPQNSPSRIPIAAVTGTNGKTTTARMLAHIHKMTGKHVGLTTTDGVYIDGQKTVPGDMTGPVAAKMVLADPHVDCAVLEVARGGILRAGLGVRHVDVGAVLNVQSDHLGLRGINTLDELAMVKRVIVEIARDVAVLNADDARVLRMADYTDAKHVCYVTMNPQHTLVREHIKAGGRAVVLEAGMGGQMITIYDHGAHIPLLWTHLIPATVEGKATHNVQNAMFAAAMAHGMGVKLEDIRHGLQTFESSFFQAPGRGNIYNEHPFKVILDYGHNASAVEAMCQLAKRLDVEGRRICVLAAPGDRRDEDIRAIGAIAAQARFDYYICKRDDNPRGRKLDEVPTLLRESLLAGGIDEKCIEVIPDEIDALERALRIAITGDLLLCFIDQVSRSWSQVAQFRPDLPASPKPRSAAAVEMPEVPEPQVGLLEAIIRDERGVRLAREQED